MKTIVNPSFFNAVLEYNKQNEERIKEICSPLKTCFNISYFGYCRIFNQGRYVLISNCFAWKANACFHNYFLNTKFFREVPNYLSKYKPLKIIWPENIVDDSG